MGINFNGGNSMKFKKLLLLGLISLPILGMERPPQQPLNDKRSHVCEDETDDMTVLEINLKIRRPSKKARVSYACQIPGCAIKSTNVAQLAVHTLKHSDDNPRPFICDQQGCSKSFKAKAHLANHMRAHKQKLPNKVNIAEVTQPLLPPSAPQAAAAAQELELASTENDLALNATLAQEEESSGPIIRKAAKRVIVEDNPVDEVTPVAAGKYKCCACDKRYEKVSELLTHDKESHPGVYHCKYRDQGCKFQTQFCNTVSGHERRSCALNPQKEEPKFTCKQCERGFYSKLYYRMHQKRHTS